MNRIRLADKFSKVEGFWKPRIVGELNGQYVKIAKFKGRMVWHTHENEDEFFQVIHGKIVIHLRDRLVELEQGDCFIVPRGMEHLPEAEDEAHVLLFEPKQTAHTGKEQNELTVPLSEQEWI